MEKNVEQKKNQAVVTLRFDQKEWADALEQAYKKHGSHYKLDGFRAGKAPRKMIEKQYGETVFYNDAVSDLVVDNFYKQDFFGLKLAFEPQVAIKEIGENGVVVAIECDLVPEVKLGQYTGLEIKKTEVKVGKKDVDAYLERLQQTRAKQITAGKGVALATGNIAVIDFKGSIDGEYFEGGTADNYELEIGSHSFIDNFEDQLVGMKVGENRVVNVTFPKDYGMEKFQNKKAKFEVKLNNILVKELPALDDQFAKETSQFENMADFKADILKKLTEQATKQAERTDTEKLYETICDNAKVDVPDRMMHEYAHAMIHDMEHELSHQGITMEMYAQYLGTTVEQIHDEQHKIAAKQVKMELVMNAIIEKEKLSDKDRQKTWEKLSIFLKGRNKIC